MVQNCFVECDSDSFTLSGSTNCPQYMRGEEGHKNANAEVDKVQRKSRHFIIQCVGGVTDKHECAVYDIAFLENITEYVVVYT